MSRYTVSNSVAVSGSAATVTQMTSLVSAAARIFSIYDVWLGMSGTLGAADATLQWDLFAVTASTAGGALTPVPLAVGGAASATTATSAPTAVTTTGQSLLPQIFNSRTTIRWVPYNDLARIIVPGGGGTAGTVDSQNQQPGTVGSLSIKNAISFEE